MKLTNKEASEWLIAKKRDYIHGGDEDYDERRKLALDMGAEALENQTSIIAELEKIKAEIQGLIDFEESCCDNTILGYECLDVIDKHISELKGENNG